MKIFISHTDYALYSPAVYQLCHLTVESGVFSRLQYIRKDKRPLQTLTLRATVQKIKRYIQRTEVRVITVIYQQASRFCLPLLPNALLPVPALPCVPLSVRQEASDTGKPPGSSANFQIEASSIKGNVNVLSISK